MLIQHARNCLFGRCSNHALFFLAVLEEDQSRNTFDAEALRDRRIVIDIKLHHAGVAGIFLGDSFDRGCQHATWCAPCGPEIYQNRTIRFQYIIFKSAIAGLFDMLTHLNLNSLSANDFDSALTRSLNLIMAGSGDFMVKLKISSRRRGPRVVGGHSVTPYLCPNIGLSIKVNRFAYFFKHSGSCIGSELETIALISHYIIVLNCVIKPAGGPDDWNRTIAHAVHLVQATRLVQRRHDENISSGFDLVRQRFSRIALIDANPMRRRVMPALQEIFVLSLSRAQRNKERTGLQNAGRGLPDEVITLLTHQTGDDRNDWALWFFGKIETTQQIEFTFPLTRQIVDRKVGGNIRISFRIPGFVVDAVSDS